MEKGGDEEERKGRELFPPLSLSLLCRSRALGRCECDGQ